LEKKFKDDRECEYVFEKLSKVIKDFKDSVPLIEKLKGSSISERHWEKLMKETGQNFELNVKTITLE
jgi:dynein heavy chain